MSELPKFEPPPEDDAAICEDEITTIDFHLARITKATERLNNKNEEWLKFIAEIKDAKWSERVNKAYTEFSTRTPFMNDINDDFKAIDMLNAKKQDYKLALTRTRRRSTKASASSTTRPDTASVQLLKLMLHKFGGDCKQFPSFWDNFNATFTKTHLFFTLLFF